jgi:uncharacterized protein YndB with AHSA1/START domain
MRVATGGNVTETERVIDATPEQVFAVLADGWSYASWVVGAAHMRDVDASWPAVGSRLHHRVGPWPFNINDRTVVRAVTPGRLLELDARAWPVGSATVRIRLEPVDGGGRTRVRLTEWLSSPLGSKLPATVQAALLVPRNKESLARLEDLAVHREAGR